MISISSRLYAESGTTALSFSGESACATKGSGKELLPYERLESVVPLDAVREDGMLNCIELSATVGWSPWLTPRRTRLITEKKTIPWGAFLGGATEGRSNSR